MKAFQLFCLALLDLTHTYAHTYTPTYTLAVRFFVHIPAGTYLGQIEKTINFRSIAKLLVRHDLFWQLRSLLCLYIYLY